MWGDDVIDEIAEMLGVRVEERMRGGQFGAYRAVGRDDRPLVLKAWPYPVFGADWQRGAALAERLRRSGYPAPEYLGAGATDQACWSLQELLPGEVPAALTEPMAEQMTELARRHKDAADVDVDVPAELRASMRQAITTLMTTEVTAALAAELKSLLERTASVNLRSRDIAHSDFHSQNLLVEAECVSGVFDWEGARPGDWRCDLANLVVTCDATTPIEALRSEPADVAAIFVAWHSARYLAFDITNHPPARVQEMAPLVEHRLAKWWRV